MNFPSSIKLFNLTVEIFQNKVFKREFYFDSLEIKRQLYSSNMTSSIISAMILGAASSTSVQYQYSPYSGYYEGYGGYGGRYQ